MRASRSITASTRRRSRAQRPKCCARGTSSAAVRRSRCNRRGYAYDLPRTLWGKLEEIVLALRIEAGTSKAHILEAYVNRPADG